MGVESGVGGGVGGGDAAHLPLQFVGVEFGVARVLGQVPHQVTPPITQRQADEK